MTGVQSVETDALAAQYFCGSTLKYIIHVFSV